jgi:hypothetical protein
MAQLRAPRAPQAPRLRLRSLRASGSAELDGRYVKPRGHDVVPVPPYERWDRFRPWFGDHWEQGDHVVLVGRTKSGKTTLARDILDIRSFVVVMATKPQDAALYAPLKDKGYVVKSSFDAADFSDPRVVFRPTLDDPTARGMAKQAEAFSDALIGIFAAGGWTIYMDEVRYLSQNLSLRNELDALWLQGRSLDVTIVAATQRPVSVPLNAFEQATHFFLWRTTDRQDRLRASEYVGVNAPAAFETLPKLPQHETLYVDAVTDHARRTRYE